MLTRSYRRQGKVDRGRACSLGYANRAIGVVPPGLEPTQPAQEEFLHGRATFHLLYVLHRNGNFGRAGYNRIEPTSSLTSLIFCSFR